MQKSLPAIRPTLVVAAVVLVALVASACGTQNADLARGRVLFLQKCGTCHVLAQAGSTATAGPNLDKAFAPARDVGMDSDTIEGIVAKQIEYPRVQDETSIIYMPPNLVTGQGVIDVAAYVARYAGVPGAAPPMVPGGPGAQVFANNGCGGCHTFAAGNSGGVTGPNLDEALAGQSPGYVKQAITNPNAQQTPGFPLNVMPQNYGETIPPDQLDQLVEFLLGSSGGGGAGGREEGSAPDAPASSKSGGGKPAERKKRGSKKQA